MMKLEAKKAKVQQLTEKLESATALYLTDFTGLDVEKMTDLRARLRDAGVEYVVVKNTLALRAFDDLDLPDVGEFFSGPTGLVIGREDPVVAAKVLDEFAQDHEDRPAVKVGLLEERQVSAEEVAELAKLPPREELLMELAGAMQAPTVQLAFLMQGLLDEFVGLLEALRAEREEA